MLCFKVVLQLVFFFFKLAWASVTILGSKLIFWGKNLWNNTLYEKEENKMVGILCQDFKFVLVAEVFIVCARLLQRRKKLRSSRE